MTVGVNPSASTPARHPRSRRAFLSQAATVLGLPIALAACTRTDSDVPPAQSAAPEAEVGFQHGVASGDPLQDRVVLWTRATPTTAGTTPIPVDWAIATDAAMVGVVQYGRVWADADRDYTVKIDVADLASATTYYYQFEVASQRSPIGQTKTLPVGSVDRVRLGVASCANYPGGYFHGYRKLAERDDLDVVLHLGDYIYEYPNLYFGDGAPLGRVPDPNHELLTLADYRTRHRQYKLDQDLQAAHARHPFIAIWDDHEIANDAYRLGAQNHQTETEGDYEARSQAAVKAYLEWMPIRESLDSEDVVIYRTFEFGDLLQLTMLDARFVGRDAPVLDTCSIEQISSEERSMLGQSQEEWLFEELRRFGYSATTWCAIGQQVMLGQLSDTSTYCVADPDQWDGYGASRNRLLDALAAEEIDNVLVLTGDAHSSWAMDIAEDPFDPTHYDADSGSGSLAVEFVVPGLASAGPGGSTAGLGATHPHVRYAELTQQGYVVVDITTARVEAQWYFLDDVRAAVSGERLGAEHAVLSGANHIRR